VAKKWQELEFLDYKERQIRRRAQKKRRLLEEGADGPDGVGAAAAEGRTQVRILIIGIVAIVLVFGYFIYLRSGAAGPVGVGLKLTRMRGDVNLAGMLKEWKPSDGEEVPENVRVVTGRDGKAELGLHVQDTSIQLFEDSDVLFKGLRMGSAAGKDGERDFQLDVEVLKGSVVFEFKNDDGVGILHVHLPTGVELWGKLVYLKVVADGTKVRVIVADGLVKAEYHGEKTIIPGDRMMVSSDGEPISTPRALNVIREIWTW